MNSKLSLLTIISFSSLLYSTTIKAQETSNTNTTGKTTMATDSVFDKVEIEASIDMAAWRKHLELNLPGYLENAVRKGMKAGQYTVNIRFLVEKNGRMSDVVALDDPGFGLAKAAVTVVKTGPRWKAGELNGNKVRSYHTQPITFMIVEK